MKKDKRDNQISEKIALMVSNESLERDRLLILLFSQLVINHFAPIWLSKDHWWMTVPIKHGCDLQIICGVETNGKVSLRTRLDNKDELRRGYPPELPVFKTVEEVMAEVIRVYELLKETPVPSSIVKTAEVKR